MMDGRTYQRLYARHRRAAVLDTQRQAARVCPRRSGPGVCASALDVVTDGRGGTRTICRRCERREAGLCRDCPARVEGRVRSAIRCAACKVKARRMYSDRYRARHPDAHLASARRYYRASIKRRRARNEYKRHWRKLNRDKVREQKRRSTLRGTNKNAQRRLRERRKIAGVSVIAAQPIQRTCTSCSTVVRGRTKKCLLCKESERRAAEASLVSHRGRGRRTDLERAA